MAKSELEQYQEDQKRIDLKIDSIMKSRKVMFELMTQGHRDMVRDLLKEAYFSGRADGIAEAYYDIQENNK